ncbi:CDP-diacylglycerol---serine O-phosphatidyltransferase [Actinopolyspora mzabensis]|uniref:CDP-diacylglycerol---serine O-phosphatidyltransferase n=2 Tax=Actinopolyspora mzabensis TaxID=995066 RepID=A0A1G9A0N7_ACTMZ|nr:CDP-diacylglycerol---serine O-phosphatidyltransferase [Actinopolyspora mzabensis]
MLSFLRDGANLCTFAGLACGMLMMYLAFSGQLALAAAAGLWSGVFDSLDGVIARRSPRRSEALREFGGQLDSLVDAVCGGVAVAVLVLAAGDFHPAFLPVALVTIGAPVLRLAYFNVYGMQADYFIGAPIIYNLLVAATVTLFSPLLSDQGFAVTLAIAAILVATANVLPFRVPKFKGAGLRALVFVLVILSTVLIGISLNE